MIAVQPSVISRGSGLRWVQRRISTSRAGLTSAELFYVVAGAVEVLVGDEIVLAGAGDLVAIPPGVVHAFAAAAGRDAELLVLTPTVERFDLLRQAFGHTVHPDGDPDRFDTHPDHSPTWATARRTTP